MQASRLSSCMHGSSPTKTASNSCRKLSLSLHCYFWCAVDACMHAGIKAIKLYAWEQPYIDRINQLREAELKMIRKAAFYQIFNTMMFGGGPILVSLASFGTYTLLGYPLTASVAFPALALFNLLRFPVMMFPNQIMNLIAAKVALDRIQNYMQVNMQLNFDGLKKRLLLHVKLHAL